MTKFQGVFPALITPFHQDGTLNEQAFRDVMESCIQAGVDGFWVSGGTGESVLLSDEENIRVTEISADQAQGRIQNIIHVGALTTASAVKLAKAARKAKVEAISCVPPFFYRPKDDAIIDHYKAISEAAGLPLFVYNQPKYTGVEITPPLMAELIDKIPLVAGVKHSAPDFHNIRKFSQLGIDVLTGSGALFLSALTNGASGVVDGPLTVAPEIWVEAYTSFKAGDIAKSTALQEKGAKLIDLAGKYGMQATCKVLVQARLGFETGIPRPPLSSLSSEETKNLIKEAAAIGILSKEQI